MGAHQTALDFVAAPAPLPAVSGEARLRHVLCESLNAPIVLTFTDNTRTMISARRRNGVTHVRLHHMFIDADAATLRAVARFLSEGRAKASRALQQFIESRTERIDRPRRPLRRAGPRSRTLSGTRSRAGSGTHSGTMQRLARAVSRPDLVPASAPRGGVGHHHDLQAILREVNVRYFEPTVNACIGWARRAAALGRRRKRRSIKLGSYLGRARSIRIHPVLDAGWVPRFFVEYIVYHEMLHDVLGMPVRNGRRRLHGPEFRARERLFDRYAEAIAWERDNLDRLLSG
jgi:hypothetical protein